MNRSYDRDDDLQDLHDTGSREREISLGTTTILGIFFVLALLCAVFFGFGYSMGRRSAQPLAGTSDTAAASDSTNAKPSPSSTGGRASAASHGGNEAVDGEGASTTSVDSTTPSSPAPGKLSPATIAARSQPTRVDSSTQPTANSAIKPVSMPRPATAITSPSGPVAIPSLGLAVVQVAAVSHQEDANVLMSALKKHGYNVAVRQEPQDKLLHVQVGPFTNKKDAEAMRQRLLADGYNAIVK